jgi:hypothetical protein
MVGQMCAPAAVNRAAFAPNALGTFGSVGKNAFRGPSGFYFDTALSRAFRLRENFTMEFRGEAFNIMNWVNFLNPNGTLSASTFGQILSANDPRILQFALKLHF